MRSLTLVLLGSAIVAAPVLAQTTTTAPAPDPSQSMTPATTNPTGSTSSKGAAAAATPAAGVASGQKVVDTAGADVGTIEAVNNGVATLSTGTVKVGVPVGSFAMGANGPVIALTKAEIEAKASQAAQNLSVAVGTAVMDSTGAKLGTIKAVNGNMVTVASSAASAQLPKSALAPGQGGVVIGMTTAQFDAQAKAAGGGKSGM